MTIRAWLAGFEQIQQKVRQDEVREVVECQRHLDAVGGFVASQEDAACIVDQHVEAREPLENLVREAPEFGQRRQVGYQRFGRARRTLGSNLGQGLGATFGGSAHDDHVIADPGQLARAVTWPIPAVAPVTRQTFPGIRIPRSYSGALGYGSR